MVNALASLQRLGPYKHEGHFIYLFSDVLARIRRGAFNDNAILREEGAPEQFLEDFTRAVNRLFSARGDASDTVWIDKTPDLAQAQAVPVIDMLWPQARYIFLYRPAEKAVRSSLAVWGERLEGRERETAQRWRDTQAAWRAAREGVGRDRYVEVHQPDMLAKPRAVAGQLKPLLQLSDEEVDKLTRLWTNNQTINRPRGGERAEAYDRVALSPEALDEVRRITADETARWPALAAGRDAEKEHNDG